MGIEDLNRQKVFSDIAVSHLGVSGVYPIQTGNCSFLFLWFVDLMGYVNFCEPIHECIMNRYVRIGTRSQSHEQIMFTMVPMHDDCTLQWFTWPFWSSAPAGIPFRDTANQLL